jgi:hypothetical protein
MKKLSILGFFCFWLAQALLPANLQAQNWTTVTATNITDLNQQKLAAGQLCFLATDQNDNPISIGIGGGGQILKRGYCSAVAAGVVTSFTVPNPANTLPGGIYYRVTVKDSSTGQEVLRYTQVSFTGASFNFDTYAPVNLGTPAPLSGNAVTGNLSVSGNVSATGTVTASNIPTNILQQIFDSGTGLTQRTALNCMAGIKCTDNAGTARTDVRLGSLTTVTFSTTPIFDASTASTFKLTLTGNVTSSTLSNAVAGEPLAFEICQDATGGRTFVQPANVQGWVTIPTAASACVLETFIYDGASAVADGDTAGQVLAQDGSAATPSISFENNANTGFYRIAANRVGLALNGANSVDFQNVISIFNSGTVKTNTYVLDINNADAGISRMGAAKIGFGNGTNGNTSATMEGRAVQLDGSTSGSVTVAVPAVAGANTWTIPAVTDTAVGKATTDTLTNKGFGDKVTLYNNISTVGNGVPSILAQVDTTGLQANVVATTLYAVPASGVGLYEISAYTKLTTPGSVSSTMPEVMITFTDADDLGPLIMPCTPNGAAQGMGQIAAITNNTANMSLSGVCVVNAKASTNIQYSTSGYASSAAGMTYTLHIKLKKL